MPLSSQLEYRKLINRMKMLEKQKAQKSLMSKKTTNDKPLTPTPTVVKKLSPLNAPIAIKKPIPLLNKTNKPIRILTVEPQIKVTLPSSDTLDTPVTELQLKALTVTVKNDQSRLIQTSAVSLAQEPCENGPIEQIVNPVVPPVEPVTLNGDVAMEEGSQPTTTNDAATSSKPAAANDLNRESPVPRRSTPVPSPSGCVKDAISIDDLTKKSAAEKKQILRTVEKEFKEHR